MKRVITAMLLAFLLVFLLGATGCPQYQETSDAQTTQTTLEKIQVTISEPPAVNLSGKVVYMNKEGFSPKRLVVKTRETVTFYNNDTVEHWPASAIHPTHNAYPQGGGCL